MTRCCNPRVTLKSFEMPGNFHVRPVLENEDRKTFLEIDGEKRQLVSYFVNKETQVRTAILPKENITLRMLLLGLDQGAVGCAGAAFMMFKREAMVK